MPAEAGVLDGPSQIRFVGDVADTEVISKIEVAAPAEAMAGGRYPAHFARNVGK